MRGRTGRVMRPQTTGEARAGNLAEQRERHRVEHGGLAGTGGAVQQEETRIGESIEVDRLGSGERPEGRERERVESHQPPDPTSAAAASTRSASNAAWNRADSWSVGGR